MPPAETTTWRPARSWPAAPRGQRSRQRRRSRPARAAGPCRVSAPVSRPSAGSRTSTPRSRSVATLARVAACSHISVCIAGARTTGHRAVSSVLVSRSSARPCAALAIRSAVAGATTTRSADWPIRTCGTSCTSSHTSAETGLPDSAAHVGAPTNLRAAAVGTTVTSWPDSVRRRSSSQALYAAMPPETPRTTRGFGVRPLGRRLGVSQASLRGGAGAGRKPRQHRRRRQPWRRPPRRRARRGRRPRRSAGRR